MSDDRSIVSVGTALADLGRFDSIIDVRSESEYAEDHVPGAVNCPVLSDAERAEVGTMDRQQSSFEARRRGAAYVSRNIARHLEESFADKPRSWKPLVYCWRGGNRSGAMTHVLGRVGWQARQLEGGYRAFRRAVLEELERLPERHTFLVVCGTTGSGKSRLLQQLAAAGAQVLDLESLAQHRGSVLGSLPAQPQPSQKNFETRIWQALRGYDSARPVFVESESRKVGELRVPDRLLQTMRASECIRLELPLAARVRLLRDDYVHFESDVATLHDRLDCLAALHGRERVAEWKGLVDERKWDSLVERLLVEHYDPAYLRSIGRNFVRSAQARAVILATDAPSAFSEAARALAR
ncbi:MAG: tRNA 2-selenouridine(34) synthase MnmH [Burkholderiaceae bacterium]|jgi:tRNA 2-selenouridine synthase|nr:tRNA 2-selenouridine(34) synthase MnmH [Burkholderiaceae bacterium]